MDDGETASAISVRARRRSTVEVFRSLSQPKVAIMFALGFASGLPFLLINNTLGYWLADYGIKLATIGFISWVGMTYTIKFLWGAMVDHLKAPLFNGLGRRRGWIIVSQIGVSAGLLGMAASNPKTSIAMLALFAVVTGVFAATQDSVIDAWRIESAKDADELGLLTGAYTLAYRLAMLLADSIILLIATALGWPIAYAIYACLMAVGMVAVIFAKEPDRADAAMVARDKALVRHPVRAIYDAVIGPFFTFFKTHGIAMAALVLGMITLYHLCDYMRGPMGNPYYKALGISKVTVAGVRLSFGLVGSLVGISLGGLSCLRIGTRPSLIIGSILQPLGIAAFAFLGWHGGDFVLAALGPVKLTGFEAIMGFDAVAIGYSGVALVSYMSTFTSLGYTATQYALLSSAVALTGKFLKGYSGVIVDHLEQGRSVLDAFALFFLLSGAIGAPAILLCVILAMWRPKTREAAAVP